MPAGLAAGPVVLARARWGRNRLSAATKARIFDTTFSAMGAGADGYANPNRAHTAKTASIKAKKKKVALDRLTSGDHVRSDSVATSTTTNGAKNRAAYKAGSGGTGG